MSKLFLWFLGVATFAQQYTNTSDPSMLCEDCVCANITEIESQAPSRLDCGMKALREGRSKYSYSGDTNMCYTFLHCTVIYHNIPDWNTYNVISMANTSSTIPPLHCDPDAIACDGTCENGTPLRTCSSYTLELIEQGFNLHRAEQLTYGLFPDVCQCLRSECTDKPQWVDEFNWSCEEWQEFSCLDSSLYYDSFWTQQRQGLLLEKCCHTCLMHNIDFFTNNSEIANVPNRNNFTCNLRTNPHFRRKCADECEMLAKIGEIGTSCDVMCTLSGHHCVAAYKKLDDTCAKAENVGCYQTGQPYTEMICECGHPIAMIHEACDLIRHWCDTNDVCTPVPTSRFHSVCTLCQRCGTNIIESTGLEPIVVHTETSQSINIVVPVLLAFILLFVVGFGVFDCYFKLNPRLLSLGYESQVSSGFSEMPLQKDLTGSDADFASRIDALTPSPGSIASVATSRFQSTASTARLSVGGPSINAEPREGKPGNSMTSCPEISTATHAISLFSIHEDSSEFFTGKEGIPDFRKNEERNSPSVSLYE